MSTELDVESVATTEEPDESKQLAHEIVHAQPDPDPSLGTVFAQRSTAGVLFGHDAAKIGGRYLLLERLGSGGMGVVFKAYDSQLKRAIAIKGIRVSDANRDAALNEAQALARLNHRHVVAVYDTGTDTDEALGDFVYIVMECLEGATLGQWITTPRSQRDVLRVYLEAGEALAAAHDAGLVHRDFKPENALVVSDGVRVIDFGLACEANPGGSNQRQIAGTPKYMAPEQARGETVTPAADQYSFCVALQEALLTCSNQPVPAWIAAIIERGRMAEPSKRFESMHQLLDALDRDPRRVWRRSAVAAAIAVPLAVTAFVVGKLGSVPEAEVCTGAKEEIERTWSTADRAASLARLDTLGDYGRSVRAMVTGSLDDHATSWVAQSRAACLDHRRGANTDRLSDLRTVCLARSRAAFGGVATIVTQATRDSVVQIPQAVRSLPNPRACADIERLARARAEPAPAIAERVVHVYEGVARARVEVAAGRYAEAAATAAALVREARALAYPPLLAEALLVHGHASMMVEPASAVAVLDEATRTALHASADDLAVEAWARRAFSQGLSADPNSALAGFSLVESIAERETTSAFARALLYNNLGNVELARDRRDRARAAFERAVEESRGVTGPGELELLGARSNLALVVDDREAANRILEATIASLAARLGNNHPDTLRIRWMRATSITTRMSSGREQLVDICRGYELHTGQAVRARICRLELALLEMELGNQAAALSSFERAIDPSIVASESNGYLALLQGNTDLAAQRFKAALDVLPATDATWWETLNRARLELGLGRALRSKGDASGAVKILKASVDRLEEIVRNHPVATYEHRLGRARVELAFALAASRASRTEIAAVVVKARDWLLRTGGSSSELAALDVL
jgi:serine/threonine protein kinase/tetratricopeptide (TPR) repeat protein